MATDPEVYEHDTLYFPSSDLDVSHKCALH